MHGRSNIQELDKTIATIEKIQSLNMTASKGMTALMQAIDFQDHDIVVALLRADSILATTLMWPPWNRSLFTHPIHFAAQIAARRDVPEARSIPQLIHPYAYNLGKDALAFRDSRNRTPLHLAVAGPSSCAARWIIEQRRDLLEVEDCFGRSALRCCAGANINHIDGMGMTALHRTAHNRELELVQTLLRHSPELDFPSNVHGTPLHVAVIGGSVDVVRALLDAGAPVNCGDKRGNTALHVAARLNRSAIGRALLDAGADLDSLDNNARKALNVAADVGTVGSIGIINILMAGKASQQAKKLLDSHRVDDERHFYFKGLHKLPDGSPADFLWTANGLALSLGRTELDAEGTMMEGGSGGRDDDDSLASFDETEQKMRKFATIIRELDGFNVTWTPYKHNSEIVMIKLVPAYFDDAIWNRHSLQTCWRS